MYHSSNLYQICNYVRNMKIKDKERQTIGLLLYAQTDEGSISERYVLAGDVIHLRTVNLKGKWESIKISLERIAELLTNERIYDLNTSDKGSEDSL